MLSHFKKCLVFLFVFSGCVLSASDFDFLDDQTAQDERFARRYEDLEHRVVNFQDDLQEVADGQLGVIAMCGREGFKAMLSGNLSAFCGRWNPDIVQKKYRQALDALNRVCLEGETSSTTFAELQDLEARYLFLWEYSQLKEVLTSELRLINGEIRALLAQYHILRSRGIRSSIIASQFRYQARRNSGLQRMKNLVLRSCVHGGR